MSKRTRLRIAAQLALLCLLTGRAVPAPADDKLVLVVGPGSPVVALNSRDVHKLFLGLTVIVDGHRLRALRNESDERMRQVFYQNIVSMSEPVYDRRMLALTLQQGTAPPPVLRSTKAVLDTLVDDADAVSFAWAVDAAKEPRVRALRVLWHP